MVWEVAWSTELITQPNQNIYLCIKAEFVFTPLREISSIKVVTFDHTTFQMLIFFWNFQ